MPDIMRAASDVIEAFRSHAAAVGIELPTDIITDDKWHRFSTNDRANDTAGSYRLNLQPDGLAYGNYGDWRGEFYHFVLPPEGALSLEEQSKAKAEVLEYRKQKERKQQEGREQAAKKAIQIYYKSKTTMPATADHPYIVAKEIANFLPGTPPTKVDAHGNLLVPYYYVDPENLNGKHVLSTLQMINTEELGGKKFLKNGRKKDCFSIVGVKPEPGTTAYYCEGWATAVSIYLATGCTVILAGDAYNLVDAAPIVKASYPGVDWIVAADNDTRTEGNPGRTKGLEAAHILGAKFAQPTFTDNGQKRSDWNDYHQFHGLEATRVALEAVVAPEELEVTSRSQFAEAVSEATFKSPAAARLGQTIQTNVCQALSIDNPDVVAVDIEAITCRLAGSFWSAAKSKLYMLNREDSLVMFAIKDGAQYLRRSFGTILDVTALTPLAETAAKKSENRSGPKIDPKKLLQLCVDLADQIVIDEIKYANQRESLEYQVDMFAKRGRVDLRDEIASVVFPHKPYLARSVDCKEQAVTVADYLLHFPQFDHFIEFLVAARFARDRKRAYVWFHCDSDWGKGILISMLSGLEAVVEVSASEIEAMFEGKPVGRDPAHFKRALILAVDEFKKVNSEMKQLQNQAALNAKYQLTTTVQLYSKLFFSAEHVRSLAGENGMEDQFANRFSYLRGEGTIDNRSRFKEIGSAAYHDHIQNYLARRMNDVIALYQAMGPERAEIEADTQVRAFHTAHAIDKVYERYTDTIPDIADEIIVLVVTEYIEHVAPGSSKRPAYGPLTDLREYLAANMFRGRNGEWYLKSPASAVSYWINTRVQGSEKTSLGIKNDVIFKAMSADGSGRKAHWGVEKETDSESYKTARAIHLRLTDSQRDRLVRATKGL
jgi:phage/plasmid primase-like uncharacterized protein